MYLLININKYNYAFILNYVPTTLQQTMPEDQMK